MLPLLLRAARALSLPSVAACTALTLLACSQGASQGGTDAAPNPPAAGNGNQTAGLEPAGTVPAAGGDEVAPPTANPNPNVVAQQPNGPAIQFLGRFDTVTDPNVFSMAWPSSQILIGFEGTRLVATLNAPDPARYNGVAQNAWVSASVDGLPSTNYKLPRGQSDFALAQNLPVGHHTVRILQRTEAQMGRVQFIKATTDGRLSYTPPVTARRIEFVGDSGAAGYGADGVYPCSFSAATENAEVSYPNVVGKLLGAEVRNLSYSGKGLYTNRDQVNDGYKTLPILWQRTLPYDDPYVLWDANAWRPQVVVLITGGNDFYNGIPNQADYLAKVGAFVTTLKGVYPGVKIFLAASPMLRNDAHPTQRETAIAYLKGIAAAAADPNVVFLDLPGPDTDDPKAPLGANGFGCDQHPTAATHLKVATSVAATLKAALGW